MDKREKRMVWGESETLYFLQLMKERKLSVSKFGKKMKIAEIFGSLEKPMRHMGYNKTALQMCIKFKNLKAKYYPCKRHNLTNPTELITCEFYEEMDNILGDCILLPQEQSKLSIQNESAFNGFIDTSHKFTYKTQPKKEVIEHFQHWTELDPNDESNDIEVLSSASPARNTLEHLTDKTLDKNESLLNDPLKNEYSENHQEKLNELHELRLNILRLEEKIKLKTLMHMEIEHTKRVHLLDLQIKNNLHNKYDK